MWGSNYLTTYHQYSYSTIRAIEEMKKKRANDPNGGRAIFVGPEFVDQGVTVATSWIRSKPYTDPAFMVAMMYEAIVNTFNEDGSLKPKEQRWLDVDYLDTMVYGFFDSPEYWVDTRTNEIYLSPSEITEGVINGVTVSFPSGMTREQVDTLDKFPITRNGGSTGFTDVTVNWDAPVVYTTAISGSTFDFVPQILRVDAVPAGRSLSAYVMGDDDRLTYAAYSASSNYVASRFAQAGYHRNQTKCSYPVKGTPAHSFTGTTNYQTKADYRTKKDADWAARITGVSAATIRKLAEFYFNEDNHPIYSEWCGGLQKQADGVNNLVMMQMFLLVAKCWGLAGSGYGRGVDAAFDKASSSLAISNISYSNIPTKPVTPVPSCTAWHNIIKVAYADELTKGGYTARWMPDYQGKVGTPYMDDGGTKALLSWKRSTVSNPSSTSKYLVNVDTYAVAPGEDPAMSASDTLEFYQWETEQGDSPKYAGLRLIMNCGGNILVNQHECSNDLADMWSSIPVYDAGNPSADSLCIVTFDNFLSPTPRWSDYVLPAATTWEQPTVIQPAMGSYMYIPTVTAPPGESLSQFDFCHNFLKKYEKVSEEPGIAQTFTWGVPNKTVEDWVKEDFAAKASNSNSPFYNKTWEEYLEKPYLPGIPDNDTKKLVGGDAKSRLREDLDSYLNNDVSVPFVSSVDMHMPFIHSYHSAPGVESACQGGYGNDYPTYKLPSKTLPEVKQAPNPSGRFHVYSGTYVWQYEWKFSKWHGHLEAAERGQKNSDLEGNPVVYPIPMYFAYEDYFMEAYGDKPENIFAGDPHGPLLLTTTHSRYRSHSTFAENGYLREFTHRTVKGSRDNNEGYHTIEPGGLYSGDDWNEYGLSAPLSGEMVKGSGGEIPRLNKAIQYRQGNATYSEFWINTEDAAVRGIESGDLLLVSNPVGSVRVVARVSDRYARGFVGLHQGCWYDPDLSTDEWVDDGGNCNTLMAQKHSRVDHGNGQQSAMVSVKKITL